MGILDSKTRVMDTIVTVEGRRQMGRGTFRPEFASFTDGQAFYEEDYVSGSTDARDRFLFEATSLPADKIFLEYDDSGRLLGSPDNLVSPMPGLGGAGIMIKNSNESYLTYQKLHDPTQFGKAAQTLVTGSIDNINRHQFLGSNLPSDVNPKNFELSTDTVSFVIDNYQPFGTLPNNTNRDIEELQPFLYDKKLSHLPNFKFLPPVNNSGQKISNYENVNDAEIQSFNDLISRIGQIPSSLSKIEIEKLDLEMFGNIDEAFVNAAKGAQDDINFGKPRETIKFINTSLSNNIFADIHEINTNDYEQTYEKISVIDFGSFIDRNDPIRPEKRVFFAGKVKQGVGNLPVFINIFTLIFD